MYEFDLAIRHFFSFTIFITSNYSCDVAYDDFKSVDHIQNQTNLTALKLCHASYSTAVKSKKEGYVFNLYACIPGSMFPRNYLTIELILKNDIMSLDPSLRVLLTILKL